MSQSTKLQFYRYTLRTVAVAEQASCTDKIYLYPVPPENALSIEQLFMHFRFLFDSGVTSNNRKIKKIGIANQRPTAIGRQPTTLKTIDGDWAADANRRVDTKLDLTDLLIKENIAWTPLLGADYDNGDQTFVYVEFAEDLRSNSNTGTIELWKVDTLLTTTEIR